MEYLDKSAETLKVVGLGCLDDVAEKDYERKERKLE